MSTLSPNRKKGEGTRDYTVENKVTSFSVDLTSSTLTVYVPAHVCVCVCFRSRVLTPMSLRLSLISPKLSSHAKYYQG